MDQTTKLWSILQTKQQTRRVYNEDTLNLLPLSRFFPMAAFVWWVLHTRQNGLRILICSWGAKKQLVCCDFILTVCALVCIPYFYLRGVAASKRWLSILELSEGEMEGDLEAAWPYHQSPLCQFGCSGFWSLGLLKILVPQWWHILRCMW
jgi:hypothetical protein